MINPEFNELLNDPKIKFIVILGSGFHRQGLGEHSMLSNWGVLLSRLTHSKNLTGNFTLDFEKIINNDCKTASNGSAKMAHEIEKNLLIKLANLIKSEQKYVQENIEYFSYPDLFSGNKISDVISLNFDTFPEKVFLRKVEGVQKQNESSFKQFTKQNKLSESFITQNTSFEKYQNKIGHTIRFWHPHGTIDNPKHMVLGISNYSKLVSELKRIRNHFQAYGVIDNPDTELTWFSKIVQNPVLILGASLSQMEWAMWSAFVYKYRNYAKSNKEGFFPIFQMMEVKHDDHLKNDWIKPLFFDLNFDQQWTEIIRQVSQK